MSGTVFVYSFYLTFSFIRFSCHLAVATMWEPMRQILRWCDCLHGSRRPISFFVYSFFRQYARALLFVRDFLVTPLVDLDLTGELIVIEKPMQLLKGILAANDRDPPESRLQNQAGMKTLTACYQVGIYSSRELLGEAPGETLEIAEQEAARQAIRNMFGLSDHRPPLPLSGPLQPLDLSEETKRNVSLNTYLQLAEESHKRATC
ncbi:hypothetical protein EG68_05222 [Paragonimus skrjabini miyazakii]|uniref:Large ribosomal subunit protein mL44 n=1 Tax=Paragonimus skrjabini miyazakii TaxID=59628 RepID=A0A8S9YRI7_9TREM|nr:hypothetical protein EG68_05222 [Paragonimus skrjabini miyazakii]